MSRTLIASRASARVPRASRGLYQGRLLGLLATDAAAVAIAATAAIVWSHQGIADLPPDASALWGFVCLALIVRLPLFYVHGLYSMSWRHVSMWDLVTVARAIALGSLILTGAAALADSFLELPPLYILIPTDFLASLFLVGGVRASRRALQEIRNGHASSQGKKILIAGAGSAGEQIVRAMRNDHNKTYLPVGFVDDDPGKMGTSIHGVRVLGNTGDLERVARSCGADELLIAIPSAGGATIRDIVSRARQAEIRRILTVPPLVELFSRPIDLSRLHDLKPEDLLRREPVSIDSQEIGRLIAGSAVLVTGAGGSIGSELCRQIARFNPCRLLMLECDETALFDIGRQVSSLFPGLETRTLLGDIRQQAKIDRIFAEHAPRFVFHAAAYKHVPLMEAHPGDAIFNNVIGTKILAEASVKYGVERFVLISTDKAVNPSSVMGATKRLAEMVIQQFNEAGQTRFMAVRFGNVLGSRGSVIPIFKEQIQAGGPITITHPDMKRYFMAASEAVLLVLQTAAIGEGGEVFVLDMGEAVRILDLATDLIRMAGLEPEIDIKIEFTGVRPGEKLFEDILTAEEGVAATRRDAIFVAKLPNLDGGESLLAEIDRIMASGSYQDDAAALNILRRLVPTYSPREINAENPEKEGYQYSVFR